MVALEYRPIAALHTKLAPGCKLLLSGPLRLLNGVLLLEPHHVQLLGGEVAKYEVENAFENVLLRQLGRPLNPQPRSDYNGTSIARDHGSTHRLCQIFHPQSNASSRRHATPTIWPACVNSTARAS